jgi:photosystem II stability/assembly factor-like uncharacterized protein
VTVERRALVETELGIATVDVEAEEVLELEGGPSLQRPGLEGIGLPLLVAAAESGSRIVAVLDRRPPLALSDDRGRTWREAGGGLPPGRAVAIAPDDPDLLLYASESRLYVSRDGGVFWRVLRPELAAIRAIAWAP